jgi:hypothetical protein
VAYEITDGASTEGTCVASQLNSLIIGGTLLAAGIGVAFGLLVTYFADLQDEASTPAAATVWRLMSTSLSYAIGWTNFNALSLSLGCLPGNMYYYVQTQVSNAVSLTALALLSYFYLVPYVEARQPVRRTDCFVRILKDIR